MTAPRPILPDRVYMFSRRCAQRQHLLRPDDTTNQIFLYALAVAAERFNIKVIAVSTMSNHYHGVVHDPDGVLPRFLEFFHFLTARALNRHRGRRENFWSAEQANFNYLVEQPDVLDKAVYTLTNPVSADLVDTAFNWPGVSSMAWLDQRTLEIKRPKVFFSSTGLMPEAASLKLSVPPQFDGDMTAWATQLRTHVAEAERKSAAERARTGRRVLGRKKVLATSPHDRPSTAEPQRDLRPFIAAKDPSARSSAIEALLEFRRLYQLARRAFRAGLRTALFPAGTFGLLHYCGVSVSPS
jgi:REP element-mobilizing transposase RayT